MSQVYFYQNILVILTVGLAICLAWIVFLNTSTSERFRGQWRSYTPTVKGFQCPAEFTQRPDGGITMTIKATAIPLDDYVLRDVRILGGQIYGDQRGIVITETARPH